MMSCHYKKLTMAEVLSSHIEIFASVLLRVYSDLMWCVQFREIPQVTTICSLSLMH